MKIGMLNDARENLIKEVEWTGKNGFDFIDLSLEPPLETEKINARKVKKTLEDYNLGVIGHTDPRLPYSSPVKPIRDACMKEFLKYLDFFHKLDVKFVNIHPSYLSSFYPNAEETMIKRNIQFWKELIRHANAKGMELMVENFTKPFDSLKTFGRILEEIPEIKFHWDVGHANVRQKKNPTEQFFKKFHKKIVHMHVSDNRGDEDEHLPLGCGSIRWEEIVKTLKKFGYNRTIALEIFVPDKRYVLASREKLEELWKKT